MRWITVFSRRGCRIAPDLLKGFRGVDEQTFWQLIDETRSDDLEEHAERLTARVAALGAEEAVAFDQLWQERHVAAYRWDLWAAAYEIHGGCSDDCFSDFRSYVISLGRGIYESALRDPDSLADVDIDPDGDWEAVAYIGQRALDELGIEGPPYAVTEPPDPVGDEWDEAAGESARVVPRIARKYSG